MKQRVFIFIAPALFLSAAVCAAAGPLTLDECRIRAQQRNETLRAQEAKIDETRARLTQSRGGMLPDVRFKAAKTIRDTNGDTVPGESTDSRFALSQPLFAGLRRAKAVSLAKSDMLVEQVYSRELLRLLNERVITTFYALARIESDRANIQTTIGLMTDRQRELRERVRLGKSRESETLMLESQLATLRAQDEQAAGDRAAAAEQLSFLTGVPATDVTIHDDVPPPTAVPSEEHYLKKVDDRPDIQAARQSLRSQALRIAIVRGGLWPTLGVDASWYTQRSGSYANADWEALFTLDVPLYQGGIARGRVAEEKARLDEYQQQLDLLTRSAVSDIRARHQAAESTLKQAIAYTDAYDKAQKSYQLQMKDYRFGLVNNLDVIQAMMTLLDVKRNMDRTLIQCKTDMLLLRSAAGE